MSDLTESNAFVHLFLSDYGVMQDSECSVLAYSVPQGHPVLGETRPFYSQAQVNQLREENERLKMLLEIAKAGINFSNAQTKVIGELGEAWKEKANHPCLWDSIPKRDQNKPMGLSCSCPKCSSTC